MTAKARDHRAAHDGIDRVRLSIARQSNRRFAEPPGGRVHPFRSRRVERHTFPPIPLPTSPFGRPPREADAMSTDTLNELGRREGRRWLTTATRRDVQRLLDGDAEPAMFISDHPPHDTPGYAAWATVFATAVFALNPDPHAGV